MRQNVIKEPGPKMLQLCYWNIHGWSSKIIGNKLIDHEFLEKISSFDIVALSELHCEEELSLPGFISIKQKIRKKVHKGPKIGGGIGVFVKEKYVGIVDLVPNKNPDSIWIKIKKELCDEPEDVYIGSFYVSPDGKKSRGKVDFFSSLNEEINAFKKKGSILIQGDLNARVGVETDFVEFDKSDEFLGIDNLLNQPKRNSEDKKVNTRGKELLDLCKVNDILVANGRKAGDIFGKFTSHQYNGSAVNDYLLIPFELEQKISQFNVGEYAPWLSDHCPIYTRLKLKDLNEDGMSKTEPRDVEPSYIFDETAKSNFLNELKSDLNTQKFAEILENNDLSAINIGASIKTIIFESAAKSNIKKRKKQKEDDQRSSPWFDGACENAKNRVRKHGNDLKKILATLRFVKISTSKRKTLKN